MNADEQKRVWNTSIEQHLRELFGSLVSADYIVTADGSFLVHGAPLGRSDAEPVDVQAESLKDVFKLEYNDKRFLASIGVKADG